jgi:hydrogenase assembly chaperone HypC/HupF
MCLATPAEVIAVNGEDAEVDIDGVRLTVSAALTPEIGPGDTVLVHVGFVLARIDPQEAEAARTALASTASGVAP